MIGFPGEELRQRSIEQARWRTAYLTASKHLKEMDSILLRFRNFRCFSTEDASDFLHEVIDTVYPYIDSQSLQKQHEYLYEIIEMKKKEHAYEFQQRTDKRN